MLVAAPQQLSKDLRHSMNTSAVPDVALIQVEAC